MKEIVVREDVERMNFEAWCKVRNDADRLKTVVDDDGDVYYEDVALITHGKDGLRGRMNRQKPSRKKPPSKKLF
ncbi:hypothetical protein RSJ68_03545 [Neisseria sp. DTU_2020_1000833_1_SI_GRL_NUU_006]|nr:hypothetical protein RSJ68_03545 [Neisseria sp. DTU_2020_1000833_1_SI_GRL_NUU_006]